MPPLPGEERLLTVFADIHYYFTEPSPNPLHHRFDKGSYLYIYHDVSQNKARIDVANNPGTPDQDAFHGALGNVHIRHSTQFPTHCTLTVDGVQSSNQHHESQYEWRLPDADPRNEQHNLLRLHTLDLYFWTSDDANQFLDTAARILAGSQLDTDRGSEPTHSAQPVSSVVQQLESVAISDPAYQREQMPNTSSEPTTAAAPASQSTQQALSFPPPPPSGPQDSPEHQTPAEEKKEPENPAPLPYNPAAPAAPEPIKHREKTPPPEDGTEGTGLLAAAATDQAIPYTPPQQTSTGPGMSFAPPPTLPPGNPYASAAPSATATTTTGYAFPPPSAGLPRASTFPIQPSLHSPGLPPHSYHSSYSNQQVWPGTPGSPGSLSFAPPPQDPNAHLYARQQVYGGPQMGHHVPVGGYSNYSYEQQPAPRQSVGSSEYDVHSQLYRPTEAEAGAHAQKYAQRAMKAPGQRPRKLEDNAARLESGVNRFLKKLEQKF